tara:strand:- start:537 stop:1088 length:552 start_codon:yes stop_codon:yes gene_type:complete
MNEEALFDNETLDFFDKLLESEGKEDITFTLKELNASPQELINFIIKNSSSNLDDETKELIDDLKKLQRQALKKKSSLRKRQIPSQYLMDENTTTKEDLIEEMAEKAGITKGAAKKALETLLTNIEGALQNGNRVSLVGFGSWFVSQRAYREGINPQTGKVIKIKAKKIVKFKAGSILGKAVN